jgi:uncharacterized membrane protein HdeD (DUF308 family)
MIRITRAWIRYPWFRYLVGGVVAVLGVLMFISGLFANRDQVPTMVLGGVITLAGIGLLIGLYLFQQRQQRIEADTRAQLRQPPHR